MGSGVHLETVIATWPSALASNFVQFTTHALIVYPLKMTQNVTFYKAVSDETTAISDNLLFFLSFFK